MHTPIAREVALAQVEQDARYILSAVRSRERASSTEVAACPGWTLDDLAAHLGRVYAMVLAALSTAGTDLAVDRSTIPSKPDAQAPADWMEDGLEMLLARLRELPEDTVCWNFVGGPGSPVAFWWRRQVHENAIHRVDAELALGVPVATLNAMLAADGVTDFLDISRHREVSWDELDLGGALSVHLHATDADAVVDSDAASAGAASAEWTIDTGHRTYARAHLKADVALRGPAWEIDRWLWGRLPIDGSALEVFGDRDALEQWRPRL